MVTGEPAICFLYLRLRGFAGQAQNLVVVALARQATLEPRVEVMGQGIGRRADGGDGGIVLHPLRSDKGHDAVGTLAVLVGRRHEARARQVVEARLGAYGDDYARGVRDRADERVTDQFEEPAAALEDLHDRREARRVEVIEATQEGRGAPDKEPALGGLPQDLDGFKDRAHGEGIVVGKEAPGGGELQVRADRTT